MLALELTSVVKRFGHLVAVDDLTLSIDRGEFISVLGPSGCGKSTTLRMILGLDTPTSGEIRVNGNVVTHQSPKERQIGIVFQDYAVFPHLSPRANVAFGLKVSGMSVAEQDREIATISELLHLEPIFAKRTRDLNAAELQQIAVARTLVTKPMIVLFDEPLSNLEAFLRTRVRAQLKSLQRQLNQTAVFVTHDQSEAMALSDRIAVMNQGRLQQYGRPEDLYTYPANLFVAGFIGSPPMNLLPGELREQGGRAIFSGDGIALDTGPAVQPPSGSRRVHLGIRPEEITLTPPGRGILGARIEAVEHLGSELVVMARAGAHTIKVLAEPNVVPAVGDSVGLALDPNRLRLFDSQTGALISPLGRA